MSQEQQIKNYLQSGNRIDGRADNCRRNNERRSKAARLSIGFRVGMMKVVGYHKEKGRLGYRVMCDCGREKIVRQKANLLRSKSCGCITNQILSDARKTHGMKNTATYKSWLSMKDRCLRETHKSHKYYKNCEICDRWVESFENFLADMGERPFGKTLDRIDNSKGYTKENCRWATPKHQARNRTNNVNLTLNGSTKTLAEWAEIVGISYSALMGRIKRGWSEERAITEPLRGSENGKRFAEYWI